MVIKGQNCSIVALITQHDPQLGAPGTNRNPSVFGMRHAFASSPKMDLLVGGGEAWQGLLELLAQGFPEIHDRATWLFIWFFRDIFPVGVPIRGKSVSCQHQGLSKPVLKLYAKIATVMSRLFVLLRQRRNTMLSRDSWQDPFNTGPPNGSDQQACKLVAAGGRLQAHPSGEKRINSVKWLEVKLVEMHWIFASCSIMVHTSL